jgi:hypothetical protein
LRDGNSQEDFFVTLALTKSGNTCGRGASHCQ